jgi:hypothetical protein
MQGLLDFFGLGGGGASPATPQPPMFGFPGMTPEEQAFTRQRSMNALLGTLGPSLMAASQGGIPLAQAGALRAQAMQQAAQAPMMAMQAGDQAGQQMLQQRALRTQIAQRENQMRLGGALAGMFGMGGAGGGAAAPAAPVSAGAPQAPAPQPAAMPTPMPTPAAATLAPAPLMPAVAQRGEAPLAVSQRIAARNALDPNAPDYEERLMAINNGVIAGMRPGGRPAAPLTPQQAALTTPVPGAAPGAARSPSYNSLASMPPELRTMVAARFAAGDIEGGSSLAAQWMTRNPPNVQTVTVGGRVRELQPTGELGRDYGEANEQAMILSPDQARRLLGPAFDPRQAYYLDQNGAPRVVGNPSTNVTINSDNAGRELGQRRIAAARERVDAQVGELLPRLSVLQETLATGVETGRIEDATLGFRQIAQSMGLLTEEQARTADQQGLVRAMSAAIIPRMRVAGAGASSDLDVRMFTQAAPGLARSPQGNIVLTAIMAQTIRREQEQVEAMEQYFADNNGSMLGFDRHWRQTGAPLFPRVPADMTPQRMLEEYAPGSVVVLPDSARGRVPTFPFYVIPVR